MNPPQVYVCSPSWTPLPPPSHNLCFNQFYSTMILYATSRSVAAKSLQSCLTLYDPIDGSPPGFPVPGILLVGRKWRLRRFIDSYICLKLNIHITKITSGPITSWHIDGGKRGSSDRFDFLGSKMTADGDCSYEIKRHLLLRRKAMTNLDSILKSKDITLLRKYSQKYVFSSRHVRLWGLDHKEGWVPKNCCFQIVTLEKTL